MRSALFELCDEITPRLFVGGYALKLSLTSNFVCALKRDDQLVSERKIEIMLEYLVDCQ